MIIIQIQDDTCHPERQDQTTAKSGTSSTVGSSQADKAASHERIVKTASRRMRRDGIDSVTVAELMNEAGLTHGGFYRHFDSRNELVAAAIDAALAQGSERMHAAAKPGGPEALAAIIDGYLSRLHRDKPETGCAVAALPTDVARTDPRARAAYSRQVRNYIDLLTELTPGRDSGEAHLILAALVGALVLARAIDDRGLSDEILDGAARALHRHVEQARHL
jgi:TetR/AcrR family transcriptional regulator, transcriptional repressor for nem operon